MFKVPTRLELVTFCVLSRRDNHYTMEPTLAYEQTSAKSSEMNVKKGRQKYNNDNNVSKYDVCNSSRLLPF